MTNEEIHLAAGGGMTRCGIREDLYVSTDVRGVECRDCLRAEVSRLLRIVRGEHRPAAQPRKPSNLRVARHARGMSLEQAAVAAGISVAWLRVVERDPTLLSPAVAAKLLPVLGLPEAP